jgi:hypothetical protein
MIKTALKTFEELCIKYIYPATPDTKNELIEFWSAGIAAGNENPNSIETLEYISNRMQENARSSMLYKQYPALEEINDDLLSFEDMHHLSEDVDASIKEWHAYMSDLIERTKQVIDY